MELQIHIGVSLSNLEAEVEKAGVSGAAAHGVTEEHRETVMAKEKEKVTTEKCEEKKRITPAEYRKEKINHSHEEEREEESDEGREWLEREVLGGDKEGFEGDGADI